MSSSLARREGPPWLVYTNQDLLTSEVRAGSLSTESYGEVVDPRPKPGLCPQGRKWIGWRVDNSVCYKWPTNPAKLLVPPSKTHSCEDPLFLWIWSPDWLIGQELFSCFSFQTITQRWFPSLGYFQSNLVFVDTQRQPEVAKNLPWRFQEFWVRDFLIASWVGFCPQTTFPHSRMPVECGTPMQKEEFVLKLVLFAFAVILLVL